jgi:hypothetical protein
MCGLVQLCSPCLWCTPEVQSCCCACCAVLQAAGCHGTPRPRHDSLAPVVCPKRPHVHLPTATRQPARHGSNGIRDAAPSGQVMDAVTGPYPRGGACLTYGKFADRDMECPSRGTLGSCCRLAGIRRLGVISMDRCKRCDAMRPECVLASDRFALQAHPFLRNCHDVHPLMRCLVSLSTGGQLQGPIELPGVHTTPINPYCTSRVAYMLVGAARSSFGYAPEVCRVTDGQRSLSAHAQCSLYTITPRTYSHCISPGVTYLLPSLVEIASPAQASVLPGRFCRQQPLRLHKTLPSRFSCILVSRCLPASPATAVTSS